MLASRLTRLAAALLLASGPLIQAEEVTVGALLSLTGAGSVYSKDGLDGLTLGVEEINAAGGLLGSHPIKLVTADDQTKPEVAAAKAKELIAKDHVKVLVGTYSSACALAVKPLLAEAKVLHLAPISNSEKLTLGDADGWTFVFVPNTFMQARAVALGLARQAKAKGWKSYVTMASDYEFGRSTQSSFIANLKQVAPEIQLRKELWPKLGEARFEPFIAQIAGEKPDFVFAVLASDDNARWVETAKGIGFFKRFPCPGGLVSVSELMNQKDTLPRGMMGLTRAPFFAHLDEPMMKSFMAAFKAKHGRLPSDWAVMCYDAIHGLRQAAAKAGSVDPAALRQALMGLELATCRGRLVMRGIDRQLVCPSYMGVVEDDAAWPFPIYKDLVIIPGIETVRSEAEVAAARQTPAP